MLKFFTKSYWLGEEDQLTVLTRKIDILTSYLELEIENIKKDNRDNYHIISESVKRESYKLQELSGELEKLNIVVNKFKPAFQDESGNKIEFKLI